jgi:dTDP-4-amino-4,6-dideoxygalactose transaminase
MQKIPYAVPDIGPDEQAAVARVLNSGWVTTGQECAAFEKEFSAYLDSDVTALAVNSATSGLHLAIEALSIGPGDEVIVPTMTFTATAEIVRYMGADPVFVDCDPVTMNICPEAVRRAITKSTKAIIVVHYAGLACDMNELIKIAYMHNINIIEDAAHAFPATYQGKLIGTFNTAATVFSFYANKTMTTGEGGMVVSRDKEMLARMRVMRLHGIDRDAFNRFNSSKPAWEYGIVAAGFKYNMTDVAAAMGRVQLGRIGAFQDRRELLAQRYTAAFADLPLILPAMPLQGDRHAWHIYTVRLPVQHNDPAPRARFIERLAERGIGTSVHYIPLHRQPYWQKHYRLDKTNFPEAEKAYHAIVSLPLFTRMTDEDQDCVIAAVRDLMFDRTAWE